jgi:hypothetical protein
MHQLRPGIILTIARAPSAALPAHIALSAGAPVPAPIQMRAEGDPAPAPFSVSLHADAQSSRAFAMRASAPAPLRLPDTIQLSAGAVLHLVMVSRATSVAIPPVQISITGEALFYPSVVARVPTSSSAPVFITVSSGAQRPTSFLFREA